MNETVYVLLVDDDERNVFALSAYLKAKKYKVDTASDGRECLNKLKDNKYDIILLDMMMPVMDGFETLRVMRNNEDLKSMKVIALTAMAMKGDMEKCLDAGADEYCTKPVNIDLLLNKISKLLS
jgi:CheY-like chemotaxis protein